MGHTAKIEVSPYLRHLKVFSQNDRLDAVSTVPVGYTIEGYRTKAHVFYHNGGIVRVDADLEIASKQNLKGKHVIAFRGAKNLLPGLSSVISKMKSYKETTEQYNHNKMLMSKRVDVVLSDGLIFMAHQRRLFPNEINKVRFKPLFKPIPFFMTFRDKSLGQSFDQCYEKLSKQKVIDKINNKFINKYKQSLGKGYLRP